MVLVEEPDSSSATAVSDPCSLDALLPRLNRRGVREAGLHAALVARLPQIAGSLAPQPPPLSPSSIIRRALSCFGPPWSRFRTRAWVLKLKILKSDPSCRAGLVCAKTGLLGNKTENQPSS